VVGEVGQPGGQETVVYGREEHRGVQAMLGDRVAVGVRNSVDYAASAQSSQVVGDLAGGDRLGTRAAGFDEVLALAA
jgi:hypothetical protein